MIDLQQVKLVAHRGASADYPENTMLAFEQARLAGVDGIELDLQLSGDGRVMIHHDETFLEALRLEKHSSEELRQEDMGQGETMPFLSEVLAEYSEDLTLYLEVKLYKHQPNSAYRQALLKSLRTELRSLAEDAHFEILSFDLTFLELIGKEPKTGPKTAWLSGFERSDFGKIIQKNLEGTGYRLFPDPYPKFNLFFRSDNASLARLGVPSHTFSTTPIDIDTDYHQVSDEAETLNVGILTETVKAVAKGTESIINGKDTPTRVVIKE